MSPPLLLARHIYLRHHIAVGRRSFGFSHSFVVIYRRRILYAAAHIRHEHASHHCYHYLLHGFAVNCLLYTCIACRHQKLASHTFTIICLLYRRFIIATRHITPCHIAPTPMALPRHAALFYDALRHGYHMLLFCWMLLVNLYRLLFTICFIIIWGLLLATLLFTITIITCLLVFHYFHATACYRLLPLASRHVTRRLYAYFLRRFIYIVFIAATPPYHACFIIHVCCSLVIAVTPFFAIRLSCYYSYVLLFGCFHQVCQHNYATAHGYYRRRHCHIFIHLLLSATPPH